MGTRSVLRNTCDLGERMEVLVHGSALSGSTEMKSGFERAFRDCLVGLGILTSYEPFRLNVSSAWGREITYTPDFLTGMSMGGRRVIIETHPMSIGHISVVRAQLSKFGSFKEQYGNVFYFIVASDLHGAALKFRTGADPSSFSDEYWALPQLHRDPMSQREFREKAGLLLRELSRRCSGQEDPAGNQIL